MSKYITNDEYLVQNYYELDACNQPDYSKVVGDQKPTPRTPEETEKCKTDATNRVLARRSLDTKQNMIGGVIRGTIALILFMTHFPVMMRKGREEEAK